MPAGVVVGQFTFLGFVQDIEKFYFGIGFSGTNRNFQSYYLTVDPCVTRDTSNICQTCLSTYYKTSLSANNLCVKPPNIPAGLGINGANILLSTCSVSHCTSCQMDYTVCLACDTANGYYLFGGICVSEPQITGANGISSATGTVVACQDTQCTTCTANYQVCTVCGPVGTFFVYNGVCITSAQNTGANGINSATGTVVPCQDPQCTACINNYQMCTTCAPAGTYYLFNGACITAAQVTAGNGINSGANSVVACQVTNCNSCASNYQVCTGCGPAGTNFLYNGNCITQSAITGANGINTATNTVVPCQDIRCSSCVTNFQICTVCAPVGTYYLYNGGCITSGQITGAFGVDIASNSILPCQNTLWASCTSNYAQCTACQLGS